MSKNFSSENQEIKVTSYEVLFKIVQVLDSSSKYLQKEGIKKNIRKEREREAR